MTQPPLRTHGLLDQVVAQLTRVGLDVKVVDTVLPEPTASNVTEIYRESRDEHFDVLIGFCGGSVLDATKRHGQRLYRPPSMPSRRRDIYSKLLSGTKSQAKQAASS